MFLYPLTFRGIDTIFSKNQATRAMWPPGTMEKTMDTTPQNEPGTLCIGSMLRRGDLRKNTKGQWRTISRHMEGTKVQIAGKYMAREAKAPVEPVYLVELSPEYRFLRRGEKRKAGDEIFRNGEWGPVASSLIGLSIYRIQHPMRRKKPDAKELLGDLETFAASSPFDAEGMRDMALRITVSEPSQENQHAAMLHDMGVRVHTSPIPESPAPFTPNKYTRYIPTLDGRCVPVDVYCVTSAFGLGKFLQDEGAVDAVNHGRKKLLAPGQRGQKTALQDIKEAHASLGRAIALEEAALGRES